MTDEELIQRINSDDSFKSKMDAFMVQSLQNQAQTTKSFSHIGSSLQRQEGRLDRIDQTCTDINIKVAGNTTDIKNIKEANGDQWNEINKIKGSKAPDSPEVELTSKFFSFKGKGDALWKAVLAVAVAAVLARVYKDDFVQLLRDKSQPILEHSEGVGRTE